MATAAFHARIKRLLADHPEPAEALSQRALQTKDVDEHATLLCVLHARGDREAFDAAARYSRSKLAYERALAAEILGQLGWEKLPFLDERLNILLGVIAEDVRNRTLRIPRERLGLDLAIER